MAAFAASSIDSTSRKVFDNFPDSGRYVSRLSRHNPIVFDCGSCKQRNMAVAPQPQVQAFVNLHMPHKLCRNVVPKPLSFLPIVVEACVFSDVKMASLVFVQLLVCKETASVTMRDDWQVRWHTYILRQEFSKRSNAPALPPVAVAAALPQASHTTRDFNLVVHVDTPRRVKVLRAEASFGCERAVEDEEKLAVNGWGVRCCPWFMC
eukprot:6477634-Amphidinium_carterae.2